MKCYFFVISVFLFFLNSNVFSEGKIAYSFSATDGCKMMIGDFGWKDGQTLNLKDAQNAVKRLGVPKGWVLKPEKAIADLLAMDTAITPTVVYHCITPTNPKKIATFYLLYMKGNEQVRTEDITLWYLPDEKSNNILPEY